MRMTGFRSNEVFCQGWGRLWILFGVLRSSFLVLRFWILGFRFKVSCFVCLGRNDSFTSLTVDDSVQEFDGIWWEVEVGAAGAREDSGQDRGVTIGLGEFAAEPGDCFG